MSDAEVQIEAVVFRGNYELDRNYLIDSSAQVIPPNSSSWEWSLENIRGSPFETGSNTKTEIKKIPRFLVEFGGKFQYNKQILARQPDEPGDGHTYAYSQYDIPADIQTAKLPADAQTVNLGGWNDDPIVIEAIKEKIDPLMPD